MKEKLEAFGLESGTRLKVYFSGQPPRVLVTTGDRRPTASRGPCQFDWHLLDPDTGVREWVPGWYIASRTR
jgi:hypothetical protein